MNRPMSTFCVMIAFGLTAVAQEPPQAPPDRVTDFRVVLLGTGTPNPRADRWGPAGTTAMMADMRKAYDADIQIRRPKQGVDIDAKDITEGTVYQANGVQVAAFKVN